MLLANHTRQIFVPYEGMVGITVNYVSDDPNDFFKPNGNAKADGDKRDRPVEVTIVGSNGLVRFVERYGSLAKAHEALDGLAWAMSANKAIYAFPLDEEYEEFLKAERERKRKEAEQQRPAYQREETKDGQESR